MLSLLLHRHLRVIPGFLSSWKMGPGGKETIVSATHLALGIEKEAKLTDVWEHASSKL